MALPQPAALHVADRRPAEWRQSTLRLELAEAGVGRGDDDVAGEGDLDADRERDALHRGDQRLAQPPAEPERVDRGVGARRAAGAGPVVGAEEQRHLEPGGRVLAGEREHADEQVGVVVEPGQGGAELAHDLRREGVLLGHPVDGHHQDVVVDDLAADLAVGVGLLVRIP